MMRWCARAYRRALESSLEEAARVRRTNPCKSVKTVSFAVSRLGKEWTTDDTDLTDLHGSHTSFASEQVLLRSLRYTPLVARFKQTCGALAAADAHCHHAVLGSSSQHLACYRANHPGPGHPEWMPD